MCGDATACKVQANGDAMTICKRQRTPMVRYCAGDLRHKISILSRTQTPAAEFGEIEPAEEFGLIAAPYAMVQTTAGVPVFNGINIDPGATHLFTVPYRSIFVGLETGNNYVQYKGQYYRIMQSTHLNHDRTMVLIQTTDRGEDTLAAAEA
jgi:hypothetical protein